jgi:hypothetical protein
MAKKRTKTKSKRTKATARKSSIKTRAKFGILPPKAEDKALRDHVVFLLNGGGAHASFDDTLENWPLQFTGIKVAKFPHTAWMLLEHLRLAQRDILEFSRNSNYVSPKWPEEYWPTIAAPPSEEAWKASVEACKKDLHAMIAMVANRKIDLFAKIAWGDGQTILREALLMADHNSYHLGQLIMLRKSIGV